MSRLHTFKLLTDEEVENSPSRRDGVSAAVEISRRKLAAKAIFDTAARFQMSVSTCGFAITFFLRFYSRKSMRRNSTFIIAASCLFLASKVNDEPKPQPHLTIELFKCWFGRRNPRLEKTPENARFLANLHEIVLAAEEAVLFTIGFDFNVDLVYKHMVDLLKSERFKPLRYDVKFQQALVNFCNDLMRKDGTLVLQYPARDLVVAMYYMLLKTPAIRARCSVGMEDGRHWYVAEGVDTARIDALTARYCSKLYDTTPRSSAAARRGGGVWPAASTAASVGTALTTATAVTAATATPGSQVLEESEALCTLSAAGSGAAGEHGGAAVGGGVGGAAGLTRALSATLTTGGWGGGTTPDPLSPAVLAGLPAGAYPQSPVYGPLVSDGAESPAKRMRPSPPSPGGAAKEQYLKSQAPRGAHAQTMPPPQQQQQAQLHRQQARPLQPAAQQPGPRQRPVPRHLAQRPGAPLQQQPQRQGPQQHRPPQPPPPPAGGGDDSEKEEGELEEGELPG